ncbi:carbohydrate-binding domain-containing protein [Ruminococcus sp.]|uniref:carbohydrate-binding domain-containing protein n=1 Tax=Ruminococcus sp. TaxID=41978 RepID=UPI003890BBDC
MKRTFAIIFSALILTVSLAACQTTGNTSSTEAATETQAVAPTLASATQTSATEAKSGDTKKQTQDIVTTAANVTSNGAIDASSLFTERDLQQNADLSEAVEYDLSSNNTISITKAGVYVISGSAENATVTVEAGDNDKVQLVLNGVTVTNTSAPVIYVKNADKVFVTTAKDTTNSLSVTGSFTADGDTNTDAVIFSKDDLVLNGLGTLTINSTDNGVSCKDDLKITGGTIEITCTSDALEANESIAVADGTITVNAKKDALHAENDEDNTTGYIYICGGTLNLTTASDGIQGTTVVQIDGGTITANSSEGIEATMVQINGGKVSVTASDDGINASNKSTAYSVSLEINGGEVNVDMGQGDTDALDSNGSLIINGGTVNITANSPFDYDGEGKLNGGTVTVNGTQVTELTNQMMGGGMGGPGGMGGNMGGNPGGNMGGMGAPGGGFTR